MTATTLDELAALGEELLAGMARMRGTVDAMGRSLSVLERTTAELRQDVTRLGERVDRLEPRIDGIAARLVGTADCAIVKQNNVGHRLLTNL